MSDEYTFYGLTGVSGGKKDVSPHSWKTRVNLAVLGVPNKEVNLTFPEIRGQLATESGNDKVTVPTLLKDGKYVTDSWVIAEYLDKNYGDKESGRTLFPTDGSLALAKWAETWANNDLASAIRVFLKWSIWSQSSPDVLDWLVKKGLNGDPTEYETAVASWSDPATVDKISADVRAKLATLEKYLQARKDAGAKTALIEGSSKPSHADAVVFGWFAGSWSNPKIAEKIWNSDELPRIGEWVEAVVTATGLDPRKP